MANQFNIMAMFKAVDNISSPVRKMVNNLAPLNRQFLAIGRNGKNIMSGIGKMLGPLTALTGTISIAGLGFAVKNTAEYADAVGNLSGKLGISNKFLQQQHYIAKLSASSTEEMNAALENMVKGYGQLKANTGPLVSSLSKISPVLLNQLKSAKSNEQAFNLMIKAIQKVDDPAKKLYLANTFFGSAGASMVNVANQGEEALKKLSKEAMATGNIMSDAAINGSLELHDSIDRLKLSTGGIVKSLTSGLIPAITPLIKSLTAWLNANREIINTKIADFCKNFGQTLKNIDFMAIGRAILKIADSVSRVADFMGGWKNTIIALVAVMNAGLISSLFSLGGSILGLVKFLPLVINGIMTLTGVLIANPIGLIVAGIAAAGFLIYKNWQPLKKFFVDLWGGISSAFQKAFSTIKPIVDSIMKVVSPILGVMKFISKGAGAIGSSIKEAVFDKGSQETDGDDPNPPLKTSTRAQSMRETQANRTISPQSIIPNQNIKQESKAEISVKFENLPPNVQVSSTSQGNAIDLGVSQGYAMPSGIR